MAQQQTAYVGDDIKILVNVVDSTGNHVAATINTSTTRLHGFATIPTVSTIGTGIYQINFSGVTPSPSEGDRLICKVNGDINGTAWSEYAIPVIIVADERGTSPADVYTEFTSGSNADTFKADVSSLPTAADIYTEFTSASNEDAFKADLTGVVADIAALNNLSQADVRTAVGLATANLDTQLGDIPNNAELTARTLASADYATSASISGLQDLSQADVRTAVGLATANLDTQLGDIPNNAELTARTLASADYATSASIGNLKDLSQADIRTAVGLATANLDTQLSNLDSQIGIVDGIVDSILVDTNTDIPTLISGLNDLSQADIRTAVGMASANLDTQLGDVPTVSEFNARTLVSTDYFNAASDTVTVSTNQDKTGYSISGTKQTLDDLNDVPATDIVSNGAITTLNGAVVNVDLVDVTTTNTDMRGTDSANTVAPDNASIASIKSQTDQLSFTVANQVDANSLTGGTSPTDIYNHFTSGSNEDAFKADVSSLATAASIAALNDLNQTDIRSAVGLTSADLGNQLDNIANISHLDAADIRNAVGLASADLDTQLTDIYNKPGLSAVDVRAAIGLASANLDTQLGNTQIIVDKLDSTMQIDGSVYKFTEKALELAPSHDNPIGPGSILETISIVVNGKPIAGVDVWVTTDQAGQNIVAGTVVTDAFGNATFSLDAGSYYCWVQKAGFNFTNPTSFVVS